MLLITERCRRIAHGQAPKAPSPRIPDCRLNANIRPNASHKQHIDPSRFQHSFKFSLVESRIASLRDNDLTFRFVRLQVVDDIRVPRPAHEGVESFELVLGRHDEAAGGVVWAESKARVNYGDLAGMAPLSEGVDGWHDGHVPQDKQVEFTETAVGVAEAVLHIDYHERRVRGAG